MAISQRYNPRSKKMFSYRWSEDNVIVPTPARVLHRLAFQRASKEAAAILGNPSLTEEWRQRFEAQTKSKFFRPYIVGVLLAEYKSQLRDELSLSGTLNGEPIDHLLTSKLI